MMSGHVDFLKPLSVNLDKPIMNIFNSLTTMQNTMGPSSHKFQVLNTIIGSNFTEHNIIIITSIGDEIICR